MRILPPGTAPGTHAGAPLLDTAPRTRVASRSISLGNDEGLFIRRGQDSGSVSSGSISNRKRCVLCNGLGFSFTVSSNLSESKGKR